MRRPVVPLMRPRRAVVLELVPDRFPACPAVVRPLDDLTEPAARLRRIQPVRVDRRSLHVIDLPAGEVWAADIPLVPLAVSRQDECALPSPNQHPYAAHLSLLLLLSIRRLRIRQLPGALGAPRNRE